MFIKPYMQQKNVAEECTKRKEKFVLTTKTSWSLHSVAASQNNQDSKREENTNVWLIFNFFVIDEFISHFFLSMKSW